MQISFTKSTRKMLRRSLEAYGCPKASEDIVDGFENIVRAHFGHWILQGQRPALHAAAQATVILEFANHVCLELDSLDPVTERRMTRELEVRGEKMSLFEYGIAVNDVCMFSVYAVERSINLALGAKASVDQDLKRLCEAVIKEWKRVACNSLPGAPDWQEDWLVCWEDVRKLQQHPLWIVMDEIGITMPASLTYRLVESLESGEALAEVSTVESVTV